MDPELAGKMMAGSEAATRAFVTFLAGDDGADRWEGAVGLATGLREVGSAYPLVVAVVPDAPESLRRALVTRGCVVREVEPVYPPENRTQQFVAMAGYVANYSKLRIWEFVEYERMVYLDADTLVSENIDELFELEKGRFYAAMSEAEADCFRDKTGCCQHPQRPGKVAWPPAELGPPPPLHFNAAGMFVLEPSVATAEALLDALRLTPPTPFTDQVSDQSMFMFFLNMFFREQYKPIPLVQVQLASKASKCPLGEKKLPPTNSNWIAAAKEVAASARKNQLPAMATLAASSAAAGVVATAASNPAMCFSFYTVFIAAIAVIMISLRAI